MKTRFGRCHAAFPSVLYWRLSRVMLVSSAMGQTASSRTKAKTTKLSAKRLELMQQKVASVKVKSSEVDFPVEFVPKPIFRYSDPARGYVAAAVWKLGENRAASRANDNRTPPLPSGESANRSTSTGL